VAGGQLPVVIYLPLLGLRGMVPDSISIVAANGVQALSVAMYYAGCARFLGQPPRWNWLLGGAMLQVLAVSYWRYGEDSLPMRVMAISFMPRWCAATAWLMVKHYRGHCRSVHYRLLPAWPACWR
jgi:hypothetical protein